MNSITVLITGAGAPGAPGIIKSLKSVKERKIKVVGVDSRQDAAGSILADEFAIIPLAKEPNYIDSLLKVSQRFGVQVILPLNTAELLKLAENKDKFLEKGIKISLSEPEALKIANNKYLLMEICRQHNIPTPDFFLASSHEELEKRIKELGYPSKDVCLKPPVSNGQRGFRILSRKIDRLNIFLNEKPNNVLTTLEDLRPVLEKAKPFPELLAMEYLPGKEYSVDVLVDEGRTIVAIPREREELKMGISFVAKTQEDREIIGYSERIASELFLNGAVGFQFKRDEKGVPKIIECNPRLQGTVVLSVEAGANLPYLAIKLCLAEKIEKPSIKWGLKMIRYWEEVYK